jgi:NADH-quinone oxidoreductase subunit G
MEFLLLHHPIDCPVCDQSGECWLQDYYMQHAGHDSRFPGTQKTRRIKAHRLGPLVALDRERCILCTRCVRFTRNVTKTGEVAVFNRGHASEIGVFNDHDDQPFTNPYSGNVVDICPVGALTSTDFRFKVRAWFLNGTSSVCAGCSTGCNLRIDHSARATGGGIPGYTASEGKIYRTVGRRNVEVNKSWLCDEGRLSFHTLEKWPRLRATVGDQPMDELLATAHQRFSAIWAESGTDAVAALGSATNTNEALFLMKRYFRGNVDFRLDQEVSLYKERQDDLLRRLDKHPNAQGAIDLGLAGPLGGLKGILERAASRQIRAMWIAFHPQMVGEDQLTVLEHLARLIDLLEFSVVSTTHPFPWLAKASIVLPMAAWAEENGTYTNFAGRVQLTKRAVSPPGAALPLHRMISEMLRADGVEVEPKPDAIFEWLSSETPAYAGLHYDALGPLGCQRVEASQEVLR